MNNDKQLNVTFEIPLPPHGQGRHRIAKIGGHARAYEKKSDKDYKATVALAAQAAQGMPAEIIEQPVSVEICAILPRPQRLLRKKDPDGLIPTAAKPDADNLAKSILDGLKSIWRDDKQVASLAVLKVYAERTGKPRVVVRISDVPDVVCVAGCEVRREATKAA